MLRQGVKDALFPAPTTAKSDALNWVLLDNQDFLDICLLAGFDPPLVRTAVVSLLEMSMTKRRYHFHRLMSERPRMGVEKKDSDLDLKT